MNIEKLESLLIDYIDGKLNSVDRHYVEQELLRNPKSYKVYEELKEVIQLLNKKSAAEPSAKLKLNFEEMLANEMQNSKQAKQVQLNVWWYRVAAAVVLLIVGVTLGFWVSDYNQKQEELARIKVENERVGEMVSMITNEESAGQRILGLRAASEHEKMNKDLLNVLIKTLNEDDNINVRMAALEGLRRFYKNPEVRQALIASLSAQKDPVVQISLIQILVEMKDKSALQTLKNFVKNEELIPTVKDEANMGILVLS